MKRIIALFTTLALAFVGLVIAAGPSAAADKRPCVSRAEFRQVYRGMTPARVRQIFDVPGYQIFYYDDGFYAGDWVDDGYWDSVWYDDGLGGGYWVDEWVDMSYWDEYANWVPLIDTVRTYRKCRDKNFDRGRGRVAINFDNYTSIYAGMRAFSKHRNNPWPHLARTGLDKPRPEQQPTPKPQSQPDTPAPHANIKGTVVKP